MPCRMRGREFEKSREARMRELLTCVGLEDKLPMRVKVDELLETRATVSSTRWMHSATVVAKRNFPSLTASAVRAPPTTKRHSGVKEGGQKVVPP